MCGRISTSFWVMLCSVLSSLFTWNRQAGLILHTPAKFGRDSWQRVWHPTEHQTWLAVRQETSQTQTSGAATLCTNAHINQMKQWETHVKMIVSNRRAWVIKSELNANERDWRSITGLVGWYSRQRPSHQLHSGFLRHKLSSGASAHTVSC